VSSAGALAGDYRGYFVTELSTERFAELVKWKSPVVVLVPVGSVEPHGPHLSLATDTMISKAVALRAVQRLKARVTPLIAPSVSYGVTECAKGFAGAVSVPAATLTELLRAIVDGFLASDVAHVCLINNHLEPAHEEAVRAAIRGFVRRRASVASPLAPRWARTLSDEFKRGECHAGRYETSMVLAWDRRYVDEAARASLEDVPISLSDKLKQGVTDFREMGLARAYAGSPRSATAREGDELLEQLARMVMLEVVESMGLSVDGDDDEEESEEG
jgi:creatinine amidohydrolase